MPMLQQCGICGQALLSSDLTSDPSEHFCGLELNGAAIVQPGVVPVQKMEERPASSESHASTISSEEHGTPVTAAAIQGTVLNPAAHHEASEMLTSGPHLELPMAQHNLADLAEIGRLHMENEALKGNVLGVPHTAGVPISVPGQHISREVPLPSGEGVVVEVAVRAK
ncbi:hypothetical protein LTR53_014216 [Teratosphaeriaceae sp. CCFEE 6253]|nr:hypothetical protein LTR53_014216 [Teratosphaeriaceae sp. CCFEE 6253]